MFRYLSLLTGLSVVPVHQLPYLTASCFTSFALLTLVLSSSLFIPSCGHANTQLFALSALLTRSSVIPKSLASLFYRYHRTIHLGLQPSQTQPQPLFCFYSSFRFNSSLILPVCLYIRVCVWDSSRQSHRPSLWMPSLCSHGPVSMATPRRSLFISLSVLLSVSHSHKHFFFISVSSFFLKNRHRRKSTRSVWSSYSHGSSSYFPTSSCWLKQRPIFDSIPAAIQTFMRNVCLGAVCVSVFLESLSLSHQMCLRDTCTTSLIYLGEDRCEEEKKGKEENKEGGQKKKTEGMEQRSKDATRWDKKKNEGWRWDRMKFDKTRRQTKSCRKKGRGDKTWWDETTWS